MIYSEVGGGFKNEITPLKPVTVVLQRWLGKCDQSEESERYLFLFTNFENQHLKISDFIEY